MPAPRERILEAAAALFARSGYEGSSIADLACAIGVSKAAIYHYYPTKQDIYDAIIVEVLSGLLGR
ncbi:bacterial regulatory s, tetR family protein [Bordetella holmesii 41130]|nr:bacterial regulatory s, tetR family protein [Bordetella holmesii 41130]